MRNENLKADRVFTPAGGSSPLSSALQRIVVWMLPTNAPPIPRPIERRALILAVVLAAVAWVVAMLLRNQPINVWIDQISVFRRSMEYFSQPYLLRPFVNPPWVLLLIAPFSLLPLEVSTFVQAICYFVLITVIIYRFGGDFLAVIITLTSFIALDAVIEMNVDWFALIGLIVPVEISPIFLLLKPQLALGYYFGFPWRKWPVILLVGIAIVALSSLLWPNWIFDILNRVQTTSIQRAFNLAPMKLLPFSPFLSWIIAAALALWAFRRQDPPLGIIAWFFFTPYIALYSMVLMLAVLAIRWRFVAIALSVTFWISAVFLLP